mgnify:CR=1 FL=1
MKRLVIYFHYDPAGCIDTACRIAVQAVQKYGRVVFVTNGTLAPADRVWVRQSGAGRIERENVGFDVGAYREALLTLGREKLAEYEEIVLMNYTLAGPVCLWSGLSQAMERAGLTEGLCTALRPMLRRLFPVCAKDSEGFWNLCGNLSANLLGLGNAATPLGIRTAQRMQALSGGGGASDELCLLVVMNTASLQLIPSTVAAVRASYGAAAAFDIMPAVWVSSAVSLAVGIAAAAVLKRLWD